MATLSTVTLLDLLPAVSDDATGEDEVVAAVTSLIHSGTARLGGTWAGARTALAAPACAARAPSAPPKGPRRPRHTVYNEALRSLLRQSPAMGDEAGTVNEGG